MSEHEPCNPVARCNFCGVFIEGDEAIKAHECVGSLRAKLDELRADLDEWYQQHENVLACWHRDNANLLARAKQAEAERDRLRAEAGAAILAVNAIRNEVKSRRWIAEGRGSYEYDDDRYRDETRHAFDAIERHVATAFSSEATVAYATRVAALEAVADKARPVVELTDASDPSRTTWRILDGGDTECLDDLSNALAALGKGAG